MMNASGSCPLSRSKARFNFSPGEALARLDLFQRDPFQALVANPAGVDSRAKR